MKVRRVICLVFGLSVVMGVFAGAPLSGTDAVIAGVPPSGRGTGMARTLQPFQPGKLTGAVICRADPSLSYALYMPAGAGKGPLPVVYCFDPHGAGAFPLAKYKSLADSYGLILVGSNNSKNGNDWGVTEYIWKQLSADTRGRLPINGNRVYTCGFSGGAKVASYIALKHPEVKGVIVGGAGLPDGAQAGNFPFSYTIIAGEGDMNLTELVALNGELDRTGTRHHMIYFGGKHEWAPVGVMGIALAGLQLDAMQSGMVARNEAAISRYVAGSKDRLDNCYKKNLLLGAGREMTLSISYLDGLSGEVAWFRTKYAGLVAGAAYKGQKEKEKGLLTEEENTKEGYAQHFQQGDMQYWTGIVRGLQGKANAVTPEGAMNQRLLAYLSLAFYSISNQLIRTGANAEARRYVDLYKMVDPGNSEAWYFSAVLYGRENKTAAVENELIKAAGCGFRDKARMEQQPEFRSLLEGDGFRRVENAMR